MKRTRWKICEVFKAVGIFEQYKRARDNADYSRKHLKNEVEALKWDKAAERYSKCWEDMGLTEIIPDMKRIVK